MAYYYRGFLAFWAVAIRGDIEHLHEFVYYRLMRVEDLNLLLQ